MTARSVAALAIQIGVGCPPPRAAASPGSSKVAAGLPLLHQLGGTGPAAHDGRHPAGEGLEHGAAEGVEAGREDHAVGRQPGSAPDPRRTPEQVQPRLDDSALPPHAGAVAHDAGSSFSRPTTMACTCSG